MTKKWAQHIGDDQLVYGMPKHMSAVAGQDIKTESKQNEGKTYWRYKPKPHACEKCQAMKDVWFESKPPQVHPNCKCEIEQFKAISTDATRDIIVPPDVDIEANLVEARRKAKECKEEAGRYIAALEAKVKRYVKGFSLPDSLRKVSVDKMAFYLKCMWVYKHFDYRQKYDYKYTKGEEYQAFGNYHYALYTKAMGLDATFVQAAAGYAQLKAGNWEIEFYNTWFDDPADNAVIRKGQSYPIP